MYINNIRWSCGHMKTMKLDIQLCDLHHLYEFYNHRPWIWYICIYLSSIFSIVHLEVECAKDLRFDFANAEDFGALCLDALVRSEGVTISISICAWLLSIWAWLLSLQRKRTGNSFSHTINSLQMCDSETYTKVARSNCHGLGIHQGFLQDCFTCCDSLPKYTIIISYIMTYIHRWTMKIPKMTE